MKILISFLVILLIGCGGSDTPTNNFCESDQDCAEGYFCIDNTCDLANEICESDRDCKEEYFCTNGKCIFQPECENDADCLELNEVCDNEYQCVHYMDSDTCLGELCYGDCEECGPYTSCYLGDCANACDVHIIKYRIYLQHVCESYSGCLYCECKLQGRAVVDGECGYINDPNCEIASEGLMYSLKSEVSIPERWEVVTEQIDKNVRLNCSQN